MHPVALVITITVLIVRKSVVIGNYSVVMVNWRIFGSSYLRVNQVKLSKRNTLDGLLKSNHFSIIMSKKQNPSIQLSCQPKRAIADTTAFLFISALNHFVVE